MNDVREHRPVRIPFDRYQRYALTAKVVGAIAGRDARILEVGSNEHWSLERFLPSARIVYLDATFSDDRERLGQFVQGEAERLPFRQGTFDAVVALDVLEHVPAQDRKGFLAGLVGVAIYATQRTYLFGTNTALDGFAVPATRGRHEVDYVVPRLPLLGGGDTLDVGLFADHGLVCLDYRTEAARFDVESPYVAEGLVHIEHAWETYG